jgi:hypothetical protein
LRSIPLGTSDPVLSTVTEGQHESDVARYDRDWSDAGRAARQPFRQGLRHLLPAEDRISLEEAAPLVWGYVHSSVFDWGSSTEIKRYPNGRLSFEAHKVDDGAVYIIGFVNADAYRRIALDDRVHQGTTLYSDHWIEASHAVRVLLDSAIGEGRVISLDDGGQIVAIDLRPRTEATAQREE